jgi:hypothetical protein
LDVYQYNSPNYLHKENTHQVRLLIPLYSNWVLVCLWYICWYQSIVVYKYSTEIL